MSESKQPKRKPFTFIHLAPDFCSTYCSFAEACSFARDGRWMGHKKIREGRWRAFKDGKLRKVEFASALEDTERL